MKWKLTILTMRRCNIVIVWLPLAAPVMHDVQKSSLNHKCIAFLVFLICKFEFFNHKNVFHLFFFLLFTKMLRPKMSTMFCFVFLSDRSMSKFCKRRKNSVSSNSSSDEEEESISDENSDSGENIDKIVASRSNSALAHVCNNSTKITIEMRKNDIVNISSDEIEEKISKPTNVTLNLSSALLAQSHTINNHCHQHQHRCRQPNNKINSNKSFENCFDVTQFSRSCVGNSKYLVNAHLNIVTDDDLVFESRFESGNLAKAIKITPVYYEIYLRPDLYTNKHTQWFYFRVTNAKKGITYRYFIQFVFSIDFFGFL